MKLVIHKFKTLSSLTINIPAEITGGNGMGKTTILEAISFCLTGKDPTGKTFDQIYDNRVDLHDAIADVSYFDDYGNEYRRTVEPSFQTSREGKEEIKILRSTRCTKNKIDTKDFLDDFADFYTYGTDYFFNQKEDVQRTIFIGLMKSLLPKYDVAEAQLKLISLKKTQKEVISDIETLRKVNKGTLDVKVTGVDGNIADMENEYQTMTQSVLDNLKLISEINKRNNEASSKYRNEKSDLQNKIDSNNRIISLAKQRISDLEERMASTRALEFVGYRPSDTAELQSRIDKLNADLAGLQYWGDLADYARQYGRSNPIVSQNMERLSRLKYSTPDNMPDGEEVSSVCPTCGVVSESTLQKSVEITLNAIKSENKRILESEMREANGKYLNIKDERDRLQSQLNCIITENKRQADKEGDDRRAFNLKKTNDIEAIEKQIREAQTEWKDATGHAKSLQEQLDNLKEPTPEELPTKSEIPDELKQAHETYALQMEAQIEANAINRHNGVIREKNEAEIKEKQSLLMGVEKDVVDLQKEITDYFSNLKDVVTKEFAGKIEIGVKLQEYVITRDEYKDCFQITANGKIFPGECNGAFRNNVKLQVLSTLQRLRGYNGVTIIDNAEANTTQPLDPCGLKLVVARATNGKELVIT